MNGKRMMLKLAWTEMQQQAFGEDLLGYIEKKWTWQCHFWYWHVAFIHGAWASLLVWICGFVLYFFFFFFLCLQIHGNLVGQMKSFSQVGVTKRLDAWHTCFRREIFNNQVWELGLLWSSFHFNNQVVSCRKQPLEKK